MSRGISGETQTELLRLLRDRYKGSSKSDKTKILDEFVAVSGFHRKHAIRLLTGPPPTGQSSHLSRRVYDEAVQQVLIVAWEASDRICSKRLKSVLPSIIEAMERHGHLDVEQIVRDKVLAVSASTIDRLLKPVRIKTKRRRSKCKKKVSKQVPIKTFSDWNEPAPGYLGFMYTEGNGVPKDFTEAVRWFRKAAEQENVKAQFILGLMYDRGYGIPEDNTKAMRWYRLAARQGNAEAQSYLGFMYAQGEGVPEDNTEAVRWFRKAAEQGHTTAQLELGGAYAEGEGVPEDNSEAVRWFRLAAEQGLVAAQAALGGMYVFGKGMPEDDVQAYAWLSIAAAQGREESKNLKETIAEDMTRAQIVEAQKLSREYWEVYGPGRENK